MRPLLGGARARLALLACAGLVLVTACGRKTAVRPPEDVAPARITDLKASNASDGITLSWGRPHNVAGGGSLYDLGNFVVERSVSGGPFVFLTRIDVTDQTRLRQQRHFRYSDTDTTVGEAYGYRVLAATLDGYVSEPSNVADVVRAIPTITPTPASTATPTP